MGPIRAHMGLYGPIWAHVGPPGQVLEKASTFPQLSVETFGPISLKFGCKTKILTKFLNDSASFLLEKLKNHIIFDQKP